ncbi:MAG: NusG domain II-containing protein [Bacteroides sp.]|nr:NusG domain II-containing protein [Eubacterium sp.]MCM1417954.1 NusG domain II-containing protein [Roseburia sp.]MCM1461799.1 NusG domain II-containing protein [Bacteroides sp.]
MSGTAKAPKNEEKKENRRVPIVGIVLAAVFFIAVAVALWGATRPPGDRVRIVSDGETVETIDLSASPDRVIEIENEYGRNTVTIEDHKIFVSDADCPDRICVKTGVLGAFRPIVCLPNRLVIEYLPE